MASVLNDMLTHIRAVTAGITIDGGFLPEGDNTTAIAVVMTPEPGLANLDTMGTAIGTINIERPIVQIRSRGPQNDFPTANDNAWTIYRAVHNTVDATIDGTRYLMIEAIQTPYTLGSDENGRWIVGFSLQIYKEPN